MKFLLFLLFSFFGDHVLSVPQSDTDTNIDNETDFYEPDVPTEDCICVPFYQCADGEIVSDGSNILYPKRKPREAIFDLELDYTDPETLPKCSAEYYICCRNSDASPVKPYENRCLTRNPNGINGRILTAQANGESEFGEWPWQAAIMKKDEVEFIFKCGGALIDERHVLTVAHCVDKLLDEKTNVVVRLGEWDTRNTDEFILHEDYGVSEIIIHPQYRSNNLFNDLAILKLKKYVALKPHIFSVCLPRDDDDFTGQICVETGWGTDAYNTEPFSMIIKEVSLPVFDHDECQNMLRKTLLGRYFKLHEGFLCAGGKEGEYSCNINDDGGPLVCYRSDGTYTMTGLVSWGIGCRPNSPSVYVNVKKYINWIASKTGKPVEDYWSSQCKKK